MRNGKGDKRRPASAAGSINWDKFWDSMEAQEQEDKCRSTRIRAQNVKLAQKRSAPSINGMTTSSAPNVDPKQSGP